MVAASRAGSSTFLPAWIVLAKIQAAKAEGIVVVGRNVMESGFAYANIALAELSALPDWTFYVFFGLLALIMLFTA
eukprot:7846416-Alexandrium_andersonii.AAC.1